jgi:hypothetical protein
MHSEYLSWPTVIVRIEHDTRPVQEPVLWIAATFDQHVDGFDRFIGYYENSGEFIGHYVAWLNARTGQDWGPFVTTWLTSPTTPS